jgi:CPA2 family monovalent cation:H+ antiporter-2
MHDLTLLINITLALVVAFIGGIAARRIGLPTIVGYLLAGIAIGPFTPGFVGDVHTIQQLAELGVIFLMFGVGLHFSFQNLWRVRKIAIPGAIIQTVIATLLGFGLTRFWGWSVPAGIVIGLAISVASTVVLLRNLLDHGLLQSVHGQVAVGWLVMEDILSVLILVLMPSLASNAGGFDGAALALTLIKAGAFVVIMFFAGTRFIPWLLERIAFTRSRELFILAILAITLGTAMGASELFGVSLALGAFVAGAIISQSHLSHQVSADVFPFQEAFSVLFFVSVGMLVNPIFLWQNLTHIAWMTGLVIVGKFLVVLFMGFIFPRQIKTFLIVAVGLSQIGEFSFILGQSGVSLGLLTADQYSLILAAALISITLNPFIYRLLPWMDRVLNRLNIFSTGDEGLQHQPAISIEALSKQVIVVGYGRIGRHLVDVLRSLNEPYLVIESDVEKTQQLEKIGSPNLYGDAANSEVLSQAHLDEARAVVVTVPDETSAEIIVGAVRTMNPKVPLVVRAATEEGVHQLADLGADRVVHPELEGGLEMVYHTLLLLGFPLRQVHEYAEDVRKDQYETQINSSEEHRSLRQLLNAERTIEITWLDVREGSPLIGKTLKEADIRSRFGASVVALFRQAKLVANPKSSTVFDVDDRIGLIGEPAQIETAAHWLFQEG